MKTDLLARSEEPKVTADVGIYKFRRQLTYKVKERGGEVRRFDRGEAGEPRTNLDESESQGRVLLIDAEPRRPESK